jgi:hypothetical protein
MTNDISDQYGIIVFPHQQTADDIDNIITESIWLTGGEDRLDELPKLFRQFKAQMQDYMSKREDWTPEQMEQEYINLIKNVL